MEEKQFYTDKELEQDLNDIRENIETLKGYNKLFEKVKELKENKG